MQDNDSIVTQATPRNEKNAFASIANGSAGDGGNILLIKELHKYCTFRYNVFQLRNLVSFVFYINAIMHIIIRV